MRFRASWIAILSRVEFWSPQVCLFKSEVFSVRMSFWLRLFLNSCDLGTSDSRRNAPSLPNFCQELSSRSCNTCLRRRWCYCLTSFHGLRDSCLHFRSSRPTKVKVRLLLILWMELQKLPILILRSMDLEDHLNLILWLLESDEHSFLTFVLVEGSNWTVVSRFFSLLFLCCVRNPENWTIYFLLIRTLL